MKVERQGPSECGLATLAALSGMSLKDIREYALTTVGEKFFLNSNLRKLYADAGLEKAFPKVGLDQTTRGSKMRELPLWGRGAIRVYWGNKLNGHMAPWENGLIYDPQDLTVYTLKEYRRVYKCHVDWITQIGD